MKSKKLVAHRIVVAGVYFAKPAKKDSLGQQGKRAVAYREEFLIPGGVSHPHHAEHGALAHLLSEKLLHDRLLAKDPEFRGIRYHEIVEREEVFEEAEAEEVLSQAPVARIKKFLKGE